MSCLGTRGSISEVLRRKGELLVEWRIPRFLRLKVSAGVDWYESPPFPFAGARWHLRVWPDCEGWVYLSLRRDASGPSSVPAKLSAGLKGSGEREEKEYEFGKDSGCGLGALCQRRGYLSERGLLPGGALTLTCHIRATGTTDSSTQTDLELEVFSEAKQSSEKHDSSTQMDSRLEIYDSTEMKQSSEKQGGERALEDFTKLLTSGDDSDVTVQVGDTAFRVHRAILSVRCPVLAAMFRHETAERATRKIFIQDCEPDIFEEYLHYIYSGSVQRLTDRNVFRLYVLADKYLADDLKRLCLEHVRNTLSVRTFCEAVRLALTHGEADLLKLATDFAAENIRSIIITAEWQSFMRDHPTEANEILIQALGPPPAPVRDQNSEK